MINIGTIGYRTNTGLGYQALSYTKHLPISKVMVVDLQKENGIPLNYWHEGAQTVQGYPKPRDIKQFLDGLDVVLLAETPLNHQLYTLARNRNIKTVTVVNPEFYDHIMYPHLPMPDVIILPSVWKMDEICSHAEPLGAKVYQLHHPVDRDDFPFVKRIAAKTMHIAGKPAAHDRNGTTQYMLSTDKQVVTTQDEAYARNLRSRYRNSRVYSNIENAADMYKKGDILVLPRKYGGNCLPLNEALSSGMPVIMPDIEPNNALLPREWLVPAKKVGEFHPRIKVDLYEVDPRDLALKYQWFNEQSMELQSEIANAIANKISWQVMKSKYMEVLGA